MNSIVFQPEGRLSLPPDSFSTPSGGPAWPPSTLEATPVADRLREAQTLAARETHSSYLPRSRVERIHPESARFTRRAICSTSVSGDRPGVDFGQPHPPPHRAIAIPIRRQPRRNPTGAFELAQPTAHSLPCFGANTTRLRRRMCNGANIGAPLPSLWLLRVMHS